jgi:hypothetical protein
MKIGATVFPVGSSWWWEWITGKLGVDKLLSELKWT